MNNLEFNVINELTVLSQEINCIKIILSLMLKAIGQADTSRIILQMKQYIKKLDNPKDKITFTNIIQQIIHIYRQ